MAKQRLDLPHWLADPDQRPTLGTVPWWQRAVLVASLIVSGAMTVTGTVAAVGGLVRVFRWAAWGAGCAP